MTKLVFLDTETTSLDRRKRRIWDIGYITRFTEDPKDEIDIEKQMFVKVDITHADPVSLKIGGYWERHPEPYPFQRREGESPSTAEPVMCQEVARDFLDATIIGAVPSFDEETLERAFRRWHFIPTWRYHLIDIESMAAGALGWEPPYNFDEVLKEFGLSYDSQSRHTALGDARIVRDLYDRVLRMGRDA